MTGRINSEHSPQLWEINTNPRDTISDHDTFTYPYGEYLAGKSTLLVALSVTKITENPARSQAELFLKNIGWSLYLNYGVTISLGHDQGNSTRPTLMIDFCQTSEDDTFSSQ